MCLRSEVGRAVRLIISYCATIREVLDSILGTVLGKFQVTYCFCPHSVALGSTQPVTEMGAKEFPWWQFAASAWI
jgi:hypothetical protein